MNILYREVQHFRTLWLWLIILPISFVAIWGMIQQLIMGEPFGTNPAPDIALIVIVILIGLGLPYALYKINLKTEVRSDGIYYRFFPFHLSFRRIGLEDIARYEAVTYSPLKEYGGWGIRYGRNGKAYNVSGNRGVQLELSDGQRLLLGSQRPEEFAIAIDIARDRR